MSLTCYLSNAKVYFTESHTTSKGTYTEATWYSGVTDTIGIGNITQIYIALNSGSGVPTYNGASTLTLLPEGCYNGETSGGSRFGPSSTTAVVDGVTCLKFNYSDLAKFRFKGGNGTTVYSTTINTQYLTYDSKDLSVDNCDMYYSSLSSKASGSGNTFTFVTPDGGGATKVWFCKKGTTTPYTNFSYVSDLEGTDYTQSDDGSFTFTLDGSDDTTIQLFGSGTTPSSKVNVELQFSGLLIDDIEVSSVSDLVIGYHFDTTTEVKKEYDGNNIAVSYEAGAYNIIYIAFYKKDGSAYSMKQVSVSAGSSSASWQVSDNIITGTLASSGNSTGVFEGALYDATGTSSTLSVGSMTDGDGKDFVNSYKGAVLTYTPANGYEYKTGDDFELQVVVSGGWKFDTTAACEFYQRGGGDPVISAVTFVDEHIAKGVVQGQLTNPMAWFSGMVGLEESAPEPDYATFITPYIVTKANVNAIASAVWISEDGSTITAMDNILSYKEIYDTLDSDKSQIIKLGGYSTTTTAKYLVDYTHTRNLGSVNIDEYWHNADDYSNTTIRVYVPLIGLIDVEAGQVMGHKLYLEYRYEIIEGKGLAILYTDSYSPESIIYQGSCNFAVDEPINSNSIDSYANSYWSILSAQLGDLKPYVLLDRKQPASGLAEEIGNKVQISKKVKECSGYVEFEQISVSGLEATNSEYAEIVSLLHSGVIV